MLYRAGSTINEDGQGFDLQVKDTDSQRGNYTLVGATFKAQGYVKILSIMLPVLSQDWRCLLELEVAPDIGHMTYSVILVQRTMCELKIDTLLLTDEFM